MMFFPFIDDFPAINLHWLGMKPSDETSDFSAEVMLYYWDDRDGSDFSGWWFGPKVGGDQAGIKKECRGELRWPKKHGMMKIQGTK